MKSPSTRTFRSSVCFLSFCKQPVSIPAAVCCCAIVGVERCLLISPSVPWGWWPCAMYTVLPFPPQAVCREVWPVATAVLMLLALQLLTQCLSAAYPLALRSYQGTLVLIAHGTFLPPPLPLLCWLTLVWQYSAKCWRSVLKLSWIFWCSSPVDLKWS